MKIEEIKVEELIPDVLNPNEMSEKEFKALKSEIKKRGFLVPIVMREDKSKKVLIDGEHRWLAAKELKFKTVPCINLKDISESEARVVLVNLNRIKGKINPVGFAHLIEAVKTEDIIKNLPSAFHMDEKELKDLEFLKSIPSGKEEELIKSLEEMELEYQTIKGKLLELSGLTDFEIDYTGKKIKVKDKEYAFDRIISMKIAFTKQMEAVVSIELK